MMYEHYRNYKELGYSVLPSAFNKKEINDAIEIVQKLEQRLQEGNEPELSSLSVMEADLPDQKRGGIKLKDGENGAFIIGDPTRFDPELLKIILSDKLIHMVETILQTKDIVLHFANVTTKSANFGSSVSWHRDYPNKYISPVDPTMVRTMICLDGMTEDNGATVFVRDSHHTANDKKVPDTNDETLIAICPPGSIVAIHPLVLHGGAPNRSEAPRRNIIVQWGINGASFTTTSKESLTNLTVNEAKKLFEIAHQKSR